VVLARFGRFVCLAVALGMIPASALAQGASTANITGVVKDSSGAVLPGVTVEAASPALIEKVRSAVSDERGQYRLEALRPGAYTVTFSLTGFAAGGGPASAIVPSCGSGSPADVTSGETDTLFADFQGQSRQIWSR